MFPRNSGYLPARGRELSKKPSEKRDDCSATIYLLSEAGLKESFIWNPLFQLSFLRSKGKDASPET
jgi:hypothetical protein